MSCVCLFRHALAQERSLNLEDFQRQLVDKGRPKMERSLAALRQLGFRPHSLVSSPYLRCAQTARQCARVLGGQIQEWDVLRPHDESGDVALSGQRIRSWIQTNPRSDLMVVGHEPDLSMLAASLLGWPSDVPIPWSLKKSGFLILQAGATGFHMTYLVGPKLFS